MAADVTVTTETAGSQQPQSGKQKNGAFHDFDYPRIGAGTST
jgi:hypothetical protein